MKKILKKLRYQKYYEHIIYIICKLSNQPAPTISRELESDLINEFIAISIVQQKYCPEENRSNLLRYSYVLHKQFQIRGMNQYLKYFPLLKSRTKLRLQDKIWKKVCKDMGMKYYPSI